MSAEKILDDLGRDWKVPPTRPELVGHKFCERERKLRESAAIALRYLGDYLELGRLSAVDFSCGGGSLLEVLRWYGIGVLGVDVPGYLELLESQGIPYMVHDCRELPYPLPDDSRDIVTCIGAITFYQGLSWSDILDEFARIARRCILVIPNRGPNLDVHRDELDSWCPPGWEKVIGGPAAWKWEWSPARR